MTLDPRLMAVGGAVRPMPRPSLVKRLARFLNRFLTITSKRKVL